MRPIPAVTPRRAAAGAVAAGMLALASGCGDSEAATDDGRLRVVTTVAPITSIVSAVGGPDVQVTGLVPEGVNSHTFEPAPSASRVLSEADLVFVNGLRLEEPTRDLADATMSDGARLVEIGDAVLPPEDYLFDFSFPESDGKPNPHLWTDPTYAIEYAAVVRDELSEAAPEDAGDVRGELRRLRAAGRARSPTRSAPTRPACPRSAASC